MQEKKTHDKISLKATAAFQAGKAKQQSSWIFPSVKIIIYVLKQSEKTIVSNIFSLFSTFINTNNLKKILLGKFLLAFEESFCAKKKAKNFGIVHFLTNMWASSD